MNDLRAKAPLPVRFAASAAALAVALAVLFAASAAAKPLASFKVDLRATAQMSWSEDITGSCNGSGELRTLGKGGSSVRLQASIERTAVLERSHGETTLKSRGSALTVPVTGSITRQGSVEGFVVVPPPPGACPAPEQVPPDCGRYTYPADSEVNVSYRSPEDWPYSSPAPLNDVLVIDGPYSPEWPSGPPFRNCPSAGRDYLLGGEEGTEMTPPLTIPVSVRALLKARKHVHLKRRFATHLEAFPQGIAGIGGTMPVWIEVKVALDLTRLRPGGRKRSGAGGGARAGAP
jgi:hypothetical protein